MDSSGLLLVCGTAFAAVFILLASIAVTMRIIIAIFPAKTSDLDSAIYAAIATTVAGKFPNARITKIEEQK